MKTNNIAIITCLLLILSLTIFISCSEQGDANEPICTFQEDPDCYCDKNPQDANCAVDCTYEDDPECFCEENPENENCNECAFENKPDCFCEENPKDELCISPTGYQTSEEIYARIAEAYASLRFYGYKDIAYMTVFGTDEFMNAQLLPNYVFSTYLINSLASELEAIWTVCYDGIHLCDGVIEFSSKVGLTEEETDDVIAEAKFIRAQLYFLLVRTFGSVNILNSYADTDASTYTQSTVEEIYDFIENDLKEAIVGLPSQSTSADFASKGAAEFLLSKVHLRQGSYLEAKENAMSVIDNYGYALQPSFADVHDEHNEYNSEIIYTVPRIGTEESGDPTRNVQQMLFTSHYTQDIPGMVRDVENGRPWVRFSPTAWLLDVAFADKEKDERFYASFQTVWYANDRTFYDEDDPDNDPYPRWTEADRDAGLIEERRVNQRKYTIGDTALWHASLDFQNSFESDAERADWVIKSGYGVSFPSAPSPTAYQGLPRNLQNKHFPVLRKFHDTQRSPDEVNYPSKRPFIVMKLSEAYLIAAEASLMLGDVSHASEMINYIRRRAAAPGMAAAMEVSPGEVDIDLILDERARELTGENLRWFDLVRTGKLLERVHSQGSGESAVYNSQFNGGASAQNLIPPQPLEMHYIRPIPQCVMDKSPNYVQNPGY